MGEQQRTWSYAGDRFDGRNSYWIFSVEDNGVTRTIEVENPRLEADGDDSGTWLSPTYDSWTIDGEEPTRYEEDDLSDELRDQVRWGYANT